MGLKHILKGVNGFFGIRKLPGELKCELRANILENGTINSELPGISETRVCDHDIVVSLTTYGSRINTVHLAIASMMSQSMRPNRIILWLAEDEFGGKPLPATLDLLSKRGLEIKYCEDVKSYNKLVHSLKLCPDAAIITIDDDVMYNFDLIDRLVKAHLADPEAIYCARMTRIGFDKNGHILPYRKWRVATDHVDSPLNFATGVGGVLYPPGAFTPEILDSDKFMRLAPTADDLWFKAMAIVSGCPVRQIPIWRGNGEEYLPVRGIRFSDGLAGENVTNGGNDRIVEALKEYFDRLPRPTA
ncbi:MAG: hypothetical protein NC212_10620 [Staphylococcus sp.]|nr:hypothetical protein [Staphylococcus sp.]